MFLARDVDDVVVRNQAVEGIILERQVREVTEGKTTAYQEFVAVAGIPVQRALHHRRHAWIHDIVVDEAHRGEGHGATLLAWIEEWADKRDCEYVALASYEDNGMETWGYVVEKELS